MFPSKNNNKIDQEIAQESPEMRSILIRSAVSPRTMISGPSLQQLPKMPATLPRFPTKPSAVAPPTTTHNSNWEVETIPKVPELYHIGRPSVIVSDCEGSEIVSRISECLRKQSLSVSFDENTAVCETSCHTKFIVKIFEDDEQFIVEVQRRTGCSFVCQKHSRSILRAAKGSKAAPKPRTFNIPTSILEKEQKPEEAKIAEENDVKNAFDLINQEKHDVKMLGMSALINITANKNISSVVEESSLDFLPKCILSQGHEDDKMSKLRLDALTVLGNLLTNDSVKAQFVIENNLLQTLVTYLVHGNLNVAYQAARCMTAICRTCPSLKTNIAALGASTAIDQAYEHGLARHKLLENELDQLKLL